MTVWDGVTFTVAGALILFALLEAHARRWGK